MRKLTIALFGLVVFAIPAMAATSATATNTLATTLKVNVNVQTAVSLTLATGTTGTTPCSVTTGSGTDFSIDFGNVNGLGVGTVSCGTVTAGASDATYATSYKLTPSFSGFTAASGATISLTAPAFTNSGTLTLVEGATAGSMTAVPASGTTHQFTVTAANSGVSFDRFLGVQVSNANGAGAFPGTAATSGADSSTVTFTLTVP